MAQARGGTGFATGSTSTATASEMNFTCTREGYMKKLLLLTTVTAVMNLALISSAGAQTFGGYATGAQVTVTATGTTVRAASGSLPSSGGGVDASLLVGDIPGSATGGVVSLSAGVLHSAASGITETHAEASMADITLTVSGNQITADFLMARSSAACAPAVAGSSEITNLVINGQPIVVTGAPNQTVTLPNGTAVINQQFPNVGGTSAALNVSALRVTTNDPITGQPVADVLLATIDAEIQCVGGGPSTATGCSQTIIGMATASGAFTGQVEFRLDVTDAGDPGTGHDTFTITVAEFG